MTGREAVSRTVVSFRAAGDLSERRIAFGVDARLDGRGVSDVLANQLESLAADLLEVAAAIYAADRCVLRPSYPGFGRGHHWAREISVSIPVREPDRWAVIHPDLIRLLEWLTDDNWSVAFTAAERPAFSGGQGYLISTLPDEIEPALFSGGLDSSAGLALHAGSHALLPVSVQTNPHMTAVQDRVLDGLRAMSRTPLPAVRFRVNLNRSLTGTPGIKQESSQRSRGFLFLAAGIAVALTMGKRHLWFFENGVGAVNLPYLRSQIGSQATRSAHPRTVHEVARLVGKLAGVEFRISTPLLGMTKAEVISAVAAEYEHVMAESVSCDTGFASRIAGHPPCGVCTSCLLRLQAVLASRYPAIDRAKEFRKAPDRQTPELAAMLWQASRMERRIAEEDPWAGLVEEFPEILHASGFLPAEDLVRLFRAYVLEWPQLLTSAGLVVGDWFSEQVRAS
ncbi:7-cyano-7-deazaguanine synthase [Amycolatopsis sp. GM8]|uniref:7-cyano-7-deazaguanine synthase n=1 Tax=Amycolatopsis sp. GM8 TaxID=2896530 RepID=UPI001F38A9E5|nr:7-cyano-7-deazaguanine synthase [Amycolatopsis sp. GM8]